MEGVAGIVDWSQCRAPGQPYEEGRLLLLGEVNAAIDGAMAAGATEIVCNDSWPRSPRGSAAPNGPRCGR
jgi:D-amino peptidase